MGFQSAVRPEPEYTSQVRRIFPTLESLFEAGEAVESLVRHPGWAHVMAMVEASEAEINASLDGRLLDSRAAYAREHGRLAGLRALREAGRAIVAEADRRRAEQERKHESAPERAAA